MNGAVMIVLCDELMITSGPLLIVVVNGMFALNEEMDGKLRLHSEGFEGG